MSDTGDTLWMHPCAHSAPDATGRGLRRTSDQEAIMALIAAQHVVRPAGSTLTLGAASTSDTVQPVKNGFLLYLNASGGAVNLTRVVPGNDNYAQPRGDIVTSLPVGYKAIPVDDGMTDDVTGLVTLTLAVATSITVAYVVA